MIKVGGQFSGVGAFDQSLKKLGIEYKNIYQAEWDKYARQTYLHNYEEPIYYVKDVHDTPNEEITSKYGSLDIAMFSPPCQAFSLAGKRLGKDDKRGILFYNSHEFIKVNKPRYFIFENVKGLLSDDNGKTFQEWVNLLGGKSVNGDSVLFAYPNSVPYHLYWKVLNAKDYGVPQNRERVFLIGVRDDEDNNFRFPVEEHLTKRLKDVLEENVDDKYFLDENQVNNIVRLKETLLKHNIPNDVRMIDSYNKTIHEDFICISTRVNASSSTHLSIPIKSATSKGYEEAKEGDSINFSVPNSETRRGRVGKGVAQTSDTACNQGVILGYTRDKQGKVISRNIWNEAGTLHTASGGGGNTDQFVLQDNYKIRRLTPRECFRLMDFPDSFTWPVSDSQAYKQAGNSIVVNVLYRIIEKFNL